MAGAGGESAQASVPSVTAIIVFLNGGPFLQEAIDSVFAQRHPHWELLLVDDGSTDGSSNVAWAAAARNPERVRYFEHPGHENRGKSASRNLALRHARGEYIAFLDADDVFLPDKFDTQVALLESMPDVVMACSRSRIWFSWNDPSRTDADPLESTPFPVEQRIEPPALVIRTLEDRGVWPTICGEMMRRSVLLRVGGCDERFRNVLEHGVLTAKVFLAGPVWLSGACHAMYRQHALMGSRSAARNSVWSPVFPSPPQHAYLVWLSQYVQQIGFRDRDLTRAIRRSLWPYRVPLGWKIVQRLRQSHRQLTELLSNAKRTLFRSVRMLSTGSIEADPNPVKDWSGQVVTTLTWQSRRTTEVEVHVGSPCGPLFARSESSGRCATEAWARDGMVFYLQDVSHQQPLTSRHTLATVTMRVHGEVRRADLNSLRLSESVAPAPLVPQRGGCWSKPPSYGGAALLIVPAALASPEEAPPGNTL
jgi:GT2 family glycosyltransferase